MTVELSACCPLLISWNEVSMVCTNSSEARPIGRGIAPDVLSMLTVRLIEAFDVLPRDQALLKWPVQYTVEVLICGHCIMIHRVFV